MWLPLFLTFLAPSEETCEYFRKPKYLSMFETISYLHCTDITSDSTDFSKQVNVLQITNSTIPVLNSDFLIRIKAETLIMEAGIETIEDHSFRTITPTVINLDSNRITRLKPGSFSSKTITSLSLSHNSLYQILSQDFSGLLKLDELNLAGNSIIDIQLLSFKDLQSLRLLNLSNNVLHNLPDSIFRTSKYLLVIDLSGNRFETINRTYFDENQSLQKLYLADNRITKLDITGFPKSLTIVDASRNNLTTFNASTLIKLNSLVLDGNNLTTVRDNLNDLPSLRSLSLNRNRLVNGSFKHLFRLTNLYLDDNGLTGFQIDCPVKVKLSMDHNEFGELEFKPGVAKLSSLSLNRNYLTGIKNLLNVVGLSELYLDQNRFEEITLELFRGLNGLIRLSLSHNSISSLATGCFADLTSLSTLNLSQNKLTVLPLSVFGGLISLRNLDLNHNRILDLNVGALHPLKKLMILDVSFNELNRIELRVIMQHSPYLVEVNLDGNSWSCRRLIELVRENRRLNFTIGPTVNVSNVYGIGCTDDGTVEEKELESVLNSTRVVQVENMREVTFFLGLISFYLAVIVCLMLGKFFYQGYLARRRQGRRILDESNGHSMSLN